MKSLNSQIFTKVIQQMLIHWAKDEHSVVDFHSWVDMTWTVHPAPISWWIWSVMTRELLKQHLVTNIAL